MIKLGIDRIGSFADVFAGKRIGLITNCSGVDSRLIEDLDVFSEHGYRVTTLFTPEHGLYGAMDGEKVESSAHPKYRIPIVSLYGEKKAPDSEDLKSVDMLVYDIQDVGLRYYTYIYTMANCMKAASEHRLPFVVLDRPNPLGNEVSGCTIKPRFDSFVGAYGLSTRYGMTCGELGSYFTDYLSLSLDYTVIEMEGYKGSMLWPETGQLWNLPSPSIHTFDTLLCYNGGCFFEATNISEGRGTGKPFQIIGAPFIDIDKFIIALRKEIHDDNLAIRPRAFTPFWSKHSGKTCFGAEFLPLSDKLDFQLTALKVMKLIKDMCPDNFEFVKYADVGRLASLSGDTCATDYLEDRMSFNELCEKWASEASSFSRETEKYHIY